MRIDTWTQAAKISEGKVFRPVNKGDRVTGKFIADEKAIWQLVVHYARATSLGKLAPHDLRRTCAKLCRKSGGEPEQIQLRSELSLSPVRDLGAIAYQEIRDLCAARLIHGTLVGFLNSTFQRLELQYTLAAEQ